MDAMREAPLIMFAEIDRKLSPPVIEVTCESLNAEAAKMVMDRRAEDSWVDVDCDGVGDQERGEPCEVAERVRADRLEVHGASEVRKPLAEEGKGIDRDDQCRDIDDGVAVEGGVEDGAVGVVEDLSFR
jgi:hypothetical protein